MYTGLVCTLRMRVPVPVPYRGRAPRFVNHGSVIECMLNFSINVRFMDRSLNVCKTFHSKNQCSIYRTLIHRRKNKITFNVQFACTELEIVRKVFETNGMP